MNDDDQDFEGSGLYEESADFALKVAMVLAIAAFWTAVAYLFAAFVLMRFPDFGWLGRAVFAYNIYMTIGDVFKKAASDKDDENE